jgi:hypothetical protein
MTLTDIERMELERRISSRKGRADYARRARCILLLAKGTNWVRIRTQLPAVPTIEPRQPLRGEAATPARDVAVAAAQHKTST